MLVNRRLMINYNYNLDLKGINKQKMLISHVIFWLQSLFKYFNYFNLNFTIIWVDINLADFCSIVASIVTEIHQQIYLID